MDTLNLPVEDWESLQNIALGTGVIQIGFCDGSDTLLLAQTANFVLAAGQSPDALCVHSSDPFQSWDRTVCDAGKADRVLGSSHPYRQVCALWPAKSFGLAVVNPHATGDPDPVAALETAGYLAYRVAVVDDEARSCEPPVHLVFDVPDTMIVRSGRLWVISPAPDTARWTEVED